MIQWCGTHSLFPHNVMPLMVSQVGHTAFSQWCNVAGGTCCLSPVMWQVGCIVFSQWCNDVAVRHKIMMRQVGHGAFPPMVSWCGGMHCHSPGDVMMWLVGCNAFLPVMWWCGDGMHSFPHWCGRWDALPFPPINVAQSCQLSCVCHRVVSCYACGTGLLLAVMWLWHRFVSYYVFVAWGC